MSEHNDQTSHSTLSGLSAVYDEVKTYRVKYVEYLEAAADRRKELLKLLESETRRKEIPCILCGNHPLYEDMPHADGCELAKELADE